MWKAVVGMNVKQKGSKEYLQEDELLSRKLTYEEFSKVENGFDDSEIKEVFDKVFNYCREMPAYDE